MKHFALLLALLPAPLPAAADDPGAPLIAADLAYGQAIAAVGERAANRRMALPESETFLPRRTGMLAPAPDQGDPPRQGIAPEQAWISCDGTIGVTAGRWQVPETGRSGWYETIWVRLHDGSFRILLRHAGAQRPVLASRPGRRGLRAACGGGSPPLPLRAPAVGTDFKLGASHDQTLIWSSAVTAAGEVRIAIALWNGKAFDTVLQHMAPAPPAR